MDLAKAIESIYDGPVREQAKAIVNSFLMRDVWPHDERQRLCAWIDRAPLEQVVTFLEAGSFTE